jgi:hypothetical protein
MPKCNKNQTKRFPIVIIIIIIIIIILISGREQVVTPNSLFMIIFIQKTNNQLHILKKK